MKKITLILSCLFISSLLNAQQFSFKLFFRDAIGNKDTLTIGYDTNGSDTIDTGLGEINSISTPLDTTLDVRITDEWSNRGMLNTAKGTYHTKKQILKNKCGSKFSIQTIDIFTNHWPVTASWDSTLFNNVCRNGSFFTSINPGGWWDTGSPSDLYRVEFIKTSKVTFSSNSSNFFSYNYEYKNDSNQRIPVFWMLFDDSSMLTIGLNEIPPLPEVSIYPNPGQNKITVSYQFADGTPQLKLTNNLGQEVSIEYFDNTLNIENLPEGLYFLTLSFQNGQNIKRKIIKNNVR